MKVLRSIAIALLALWLPACATLSPTERERAAGIAASARSTVVDCQAVDACAQPSPLRALAGEAFATSSEQAPRHYALILDRGGDALLARVNLIRSATTSIDLQTYIFVEDDAGRLVIDELLAAARRGVRVRLLLDQLAALEKVDTLAALAGAHANLQVRLYNPVLGRARISYPAYALAAACCWRRLNQRMHTKLLLVDGAVGIAGGRNYQNDYYDWDAHYNFRDRDVLVAGPTARTMDADFVKFWDDARSVPAERLADVGRRLLDGGVPVLPAPVFDWPERADRLREAAADPVLVHEQLAAKALPVGAVDYIADTPHKHEHGADEHARASTSLRQLIEGAREEVLLQTPYLVLSKPAQQMFRALRKRADRPRVVVSTNSLAATDAFIAYALSYKYKRRYLREFGFNIHEYKPFPADAPIDLATTGAMRKPGAAALADAAGTVATSLSDGATIGAGTGASGDALVDADAPVVTGRALARGQSDYARRRRALGPLAGSVVGSRAYRAPLSREHAALRFGSRGANEPVPLKRAGVRIGMHAKSLVIDGRIGVIGTHNFDPRGDDYNTESAVVIEDAAFAQALAASIRRDISPANAWTIAPRDKPPLLSGLGYSVAKVSEWLPVFDLWPVRYATSYEFVPSPECPQPLPPDAPGFRACYRPVGDFPEVALGLKSLTTRIFTAFGAGLAPIL